MSSSFIFVLCVNWTNVSKTGEDQKQRLPRSPIGHLVHLFLHWIHIWRRLKSGYANYERRKCIISVQTGSYWPIRLQLSSVSSPILVCPCPPPCLVCHASAVPFAARHSALPRSPRSCSRFCLAEATDKMSSVMSSWYSSLLGMLC